jgi:hypothetical protein
VDLLRFAIYGLGITLELRTGQHIERGLSALGLDLERRAEVARIAGHYEEARERYSPGKKEGGALTRELVRPHRDARVDDDGDDPGARVEARGERLCAQPVSTRVGKVQGDGRRTAVEHDAEDLVGDARGCVGRVPRHVLVLRTERDVIISKRREVEDVRGRGARSCSPSG